MHSVLPPGIEGGGWTLRSSEPKGGHSGPRGGNSQPRQIGFLASGGCLMAIGALPEEAVNGKWSGQTP